MGLRGAEATCDVDKHNLGKVAIVPLLVTNKVRSVQSSYRFTRHVPYYVVQPIYGSLVDRLAQTQ